MKISIVQQDIVWNSPEANRKHLDSLLTGLPQTDLIVLPEMFTTGFSADPDGIAELDDSSVEWMKDLAASRSCAVAGSIATASNGQYYNRLQFVTPDGTEAHYDKWHLFSFAGEHRHYTPGTEKIIVRWKGFRILLQICYDLRFPIFSRNSTRPDRGYDLAIYVASWPEQRADAWKTLLKARAIENQCFVAGVNRCGRDPGNIYSGDSVVVDWNGNSLAECAPGEEGMATADLKMTALRKAREEFPVLQDMDNV